jgi:hypothetical protein
MKKKLNDLMSKKEKKKRKDNTQTHLPNTSNNSNVNFNNHKKEKDSSEEEPEYSKRNMTQEQLLKRKTLIKELVDNFKEEKGHLPKFNDIKGLEKTINDNLYFKKSLKVNPIEIMEEIRRQGTTKEPATKTQQNQSNNNIADEKNNLAVKYHYGNGVPLDKARALKLYTEAAELGNADAQCNLADIYRLGNIVKIDKPKAAQLYEQAAVQGHAGAQHHLAYMNHEGDGIPQNLVKAKKFYTLAAEQGDTEARDNLNYIDKTGEGVLTRNNNNNNAQPLINKNTNANHLPNVQPAAKEKSSQQAVKLYIHRADSCSSYYSSEEEEEEEKKPKRRKERIDSFPEMLQSKSTEEFDASQQKPEDSPGRRINTNSSKSNFLHQ